VSPLQKIAMGMVFVAGYAPFPAHPHPHWKVYDGLADPIGWILVIAGVRGLCAVAAGFDAARWSAWVAGAVSIPLWVPQFSHQLSDSGAWAFSMPQTLFCLLLAKGIAEGAATAEPGDRYLPTRFGLLMWAFALLVVLPPIAIGGDIAQLDDVTVAAAFVVNLAFIYYVFRVHRRTWLGGPGPLLIHPRPRRGSRNDEGRPASE
jgi:hypothetical protein